MGEYEVGKPYVASDGKFYTWSGQGDPKDKANWSPYQTAAAPAPEPAKTGAQRMDDRAKQLAGNSGDVPTRIGDPRALLALLGLAAPAAVPEMAGAAGVAARIGASAAGNALFGGAVNGAAGAKAGAEAGAGLGVASEAAAPLFGIAARSVAGRGERVADWLREAAGAKDWGAAMDQVKASLKGVQAKLYGPIEKNVVDDPEVAKVLDVLKRKGHIPRKLQMQGGANGNWQRVPTVGDLQKLRSTLRGTLSNSVDAGWVDRLDEAMKAAIPGLEDADKAYYAEQQTRRAMLMGARNASKPAAEIEQAAKSFAPQYQDPFRIGVVHRWATQMAKRDVASSGALQQIMDAGPETRRIFSTMFPDKGSEAAFWREIDKEKGADAARAAIKKYAVPTAQWLARATATAAGMGAVQHFLKPDQDAVDVTPAP